MDEKINLRELFQILRRRFVLIIVTTFLIFSTTACAVFFFLGPYYEYPKQILVGQLEGDNSNTNVQLISSFIDIVKNPTVLEKVKKDLQLKDSINDLAAQISIENRQNSQIVTIVVKDKDPKLVKQKANKLAQNSIAEMEKFIGDKNIQMLDKGDIGEPRLNLTTPIVSLLMSIIIGLFLGIGLAIFREQFDDSIKKQNDIEDLLGMPILGSIKL
nr:Wzz/FepE/Etk N-terminal domain-containing protein [Neobacillus sp. Marseille-Q6967]